MSVVGLIENVAVEWLIGKRSSERRIVVVCMGLGGGFFGLGCVLRR